MCKLTWNCGQRSYTMDEHLVVRFISGTGVAKCINATYLKEPESLSEIQKESALKAGFKLEDVMIFVGGLIAAPPEIRAEIKARCDVYYKEAEIKRLALEENRRIQQEEEEKKYNQWCEEHIPVGVILLRPKSKFSCDMETWVYEFEGAEISRNVLAGVSNYGDVPVGWLTPETAEEIRNTRIVLAQKKAQAIENASKELENKFKEAKETGKGVKIRGWMTDRCYNRNSRECSFDTATEWAMPNGTKKVTYTCCY